MYVGQSPVEILDGLALEPGDLVTVKCSCRYGNGDEEIDEDPETTTSAGATLAENLHERPHPGPTAQPLCPPPHLPT